MMKLEKTALTGKEDKFQFIDNLLHDSIYHPIIRKVINLVGYEYRQSPHNTIRDLLYEHYEELLQLLIKALLEQNIQLQSSFEEYIKLDVRPILINKEEYNVISK